MHLNELNTTKYYEEFLRYHEMASWQHTNCNLGQIDYADTPYDDDLIKNVYLYDVVERKYAGFTQLLLDMWYSVDKHPYKHKLSDWRKGVIESFDGSFWDLPEWLYIFFVHRLTGSGINYAKNPSGYHNSILLHFTDCFSVNDMVEVIKSYQGPMFTSSGYQIAPFPKPPENKEYSKGGVYFMCEFLPLLVNHFAEFLTNSNRPSFRNCMQFLEKFNKEQGFRVFRFQYAATLADIADFFPKLIDTESHFFYGKNAIECLNYMVEGSANNIKKMDALTERIMLDTGSLPYNSEDIACDCIRWIENYINPKLDYSHLCLDSVWSSHTIRDHPFGRQKGMLELGLVVSFNGKHHPSDDKIIRQAGLTIQGYKDKIYEYDSETF